MTEERPHARAGTWGLRGGPYAVGQRRMLCCSRLPPQHALEPAFRHSLWSISNAPWTSSTFSLAARSYVRWSAAPRARFAFSVGRPAGCPASTPPLTQAGQPPARDQARRVVASCAVLWDRDR